MATTWTIPLKITISIGEPTLASVPAAVPPSTTVAEGLFGAAPPILIADDRFAMDSMFNSPFGFPGALSLGLASRLSYRTEAEVTQVAATGWGLEARMFSVDDTQCFAARVGSNAFIAFRGTESRGDWLGNLNMLSTTRPYGVVHRGFLSAFQVIAGPLEQLLNTWNATAIWLTGHSLGGALATIAAAEWHGRYPIAGIATFGQPAVGKGTFGDFMKRNYSGRFFRYVNDDDIVPRVPPTYRHVGQLIHFNAAGVPSISVESLIAEAAIQPSVITEIEPPMMTEAEFDRLRAELLQQQAVMKTEGIESLPEIQTEGLFPSVRDHSMERYLEKIAKRIS